MKVVKQFLSIIPISPDQFAELAQLLSSPIRCLQAGKDGIATSNQLSTRPAYPCRTNAQRFAQFLIHKAQAN